MARPSPLKATIWALGGSISLYLGFISLLTIPFFQNQVIYLNSVTLTWFQDVNVPEQWGFLHNQVTPFTLQTQDGETLHAWHILPIGLYQKHEQQLLTEPSGLVPNVSQSLGFKLLRDDPDALLVLYFHGAAGTLGSGWRPPSYRAMHAASPDNIHTVAIEYRGFGSSTGSTSEDGLLVDAITLVEWAMKEAQIPSSRIVIFGQSLGTAVSISLAQYMAAKDDPTLFSGMVLVAPFVDVELLTATYRVAGTIPILDPLAHFPSLMRLLQKFIISKWSSKDKLADFITRVEQLPEVASRYHITIIHAEDDYDIPWSHSEKLFWHAVNATSPEGVTFEELEKEKEVQKLQLGAGGWVVNRETRKGSIREHITKYGLHDRIMSYPVVSLAILRAFQRG
ncbi:Alpha/Beta hydrolase protein [Dactylonectria macrodidyma]|uniref:Alpha/Beta hydrolase protein n=1 Tax=Dactylonectria macrodidyma TaxID=307937 RepID=A0A9P9FQ52_9HYPO|nr:Alpha/Beta hydrolase protein [Dactylonectria macrodidyma]